MDKLKAKILEELEKDIKFREEYLEKNNTSLLKAEEFLKLLKEKGKKELLNTPLFEIYVTMTSLVNERYTYEKIHNLLIPSEERINNWQLKDTLAMEEIEEEFRINYARDYGKYLITESNIKKFYNLGLPKEALSYNVFTAFRTIHCFMSFKEKAKKICQDIPIEKAQNKKIDALFATTELVNILQVIEFYLKSKKEEQKRRTEKIDIIKKFKSEIENNSVEKMFELPKYVEDVLSNHTLEYLYQLFHFNLLVEEKTLDAELLIAEKILSDPIVRLLYKNNINPNKVDNTIIEKLKTLPLSLVEKAFNFFSKIKLNVTAIFREESIFDKVDSKSLDILEFLYENSIISKETLEKHLISIIKDIKKVITNYEILKPIMDFKSKYYQDEILLLDPSILKNHLSVLAEYSLTKNEYIFLLCHFEYIGIYDLILEQNIERYLFVEICRTENPSATIKRICLCRILDIPYKTATNLLKKDVKEARHFICDDPSLEEYLSLIEYKTEERDPYIGDIKKNPIVKQLDEMYRIEDLYCIHNTSISRPKFLRNLQCRKDKFPEIENYIQESLLLGSFVDEKKQLEIRKAMKKM